MILKPLAYLSGVTALAGAAVWTRMAIRSTYRSSDVDPFFFVLMLAVIWLGGAGYILYAHVRYKTEYSFKREKMTWSEWWSWWWHWKVIGWVAGVLTVLLVIAIEVIRYNATH
jgi:hypothetical protein